MKYLIIQLCDTSVSFCGYSPSSIPNLMPFEALKESLIWAVKNGVNIQVLYPKYSLPESYQSLIDEFEHIEIRPLEDSNTADIWVANDIYEINSFDGISSPLVLQLTISDFLSQYKIIAEILPKVPRLNIFFTDVPSFSDNMEQQYEDALTYIANKIVELYLDNNLAQFNLITDRTMLSEMNNCNAGVDTLTVSPDGNFYICPAFYLSNHKPCGGVDEGISIPNRQLYKISHAPICRICDAYHCRRCVKLNKDLTLEVNTPGHQQCVMSHIERKVAKRLLDEIRRYGEYASHVSIPEIDYNDPFDKIVNQTI